MALVGDLVSVGRVGADVPVYSGGVVLGDGFIAGVDVAADVDVGIGVGRICLVFLLVQTLGQDELPVLRCLARLVVVVDDVLVIKLS